MKIKIFYFLIFIFTIGCGPRDKVNFAPEALQDTFVSLQGDVQTFESILKEHQGETILIDIWASWCKDCVVGMPIVKKLQEQYPEVTFLFISLDKDKRSWERGIARFGIEKGIYYWNPGGWKSPFNKAIDLDWIPRYIIVNPEGKMSLFEATKASDPTLQELLKETTN